MLCIRWTKNQKAISDIIRGWVDASEYDEMALAEKLNSDPVWFHTALCGYRPFRKDAIYRLIKILNPPKDELHNLYFTMAFDEEDRLWFSASEDWAKLDMGGKIKVLERLNELVEGEGK